MISLQSNFSEDIDVFLQASLILIELMEIHYLNIISGFRPYKDIILNFAQTLSGYFGLL